MSKDFLKNRTLDKQLFTYLGDEVIKGAGGKKIDSKQEWTKELEDKYHNMPISTLLDDKEFFDTSEWLYPCHRKDIEFVFDAKEKYGVHTVIDIEGIGSGKNVKASLLLAIQVFKVLTLLDPQKTYKLSPGSDIAFILMSRTEKQAKRVTFKKLLPVFNKPFFKEYFPPQIDFVQMANKRQLPSELRFPKNVLIFPGTGEAASALGYDVLGAAIDEANYLELTADSKKVAGGIGIYDAAEQMHHEIFGRMESRFMTAGGGVPGILAMFSNTRYKDDFLERWAKKADLERIDDERWLSKKNKLILIRRPLWKAKPHVYCGKMFKFDFNSLKVVSNESISDVQEVG